MKKLKVMITVVVAVVLTAGVCSAYTAEQQAAREKCHPNQLRNVITTPDSCAWPYVPPVTVASEVMAKVQAARATRSAKLVAVFSKPALQPATVPAVMCGGVVMQVPSTSVYNADSNSRPWVSPIYNNSNCVQGAVSIDAPTSAAGVTNGRDYSNYR